MAKPRTRHPRELLESIIEKCMSEWRELHWHNDRITSWDICAIDATTPLHVLLIGLPPDPPKRSYYGAKGGLRNPRH